MRQADTQLGKELLGNLHPARTVAEQELPWRERCHQAADSDPEAPLSSSLLSAQAANSNTEAVNSHSGTQG